MVRKGFLENPSALQGLRGKDEFVRVSWEQALQLIHQQHQRIRTTYGAESVFAGFMAGVQAVYSIKHKLYYSAT